ncbi:hypothetical protein H2O64_05065 [Kordia sp. YSTF-M3]|uniref:Uncharacterized protein n=1 Tax=Kordia aestuariivivens TaxID=2759037 RepID=A0ABR7Q642_9FLAO|nr:hypothetical protein [Kordia aestuariivivens]MBC8754030.1 hypothetical protein [Kordia aestuariivivens]
MKKIIRCIIISFIFLLHTTLCAQEVSSILKTTETFYTSEAFEKTIDVPLNEMYSLPLDNILFENLNKNKFQYTGQHFDAFTNVYGIENQRYPKTETNLRSSFDSADTASSVDLLPVAIQESCTTFIVVISLLIIMIIAFIIIRRIKTNTLKLF